MVNSLPQPKIEKGQECLLNVTGRHFKVRIIEIDADTIQVTFPGKDYPADGMSAVLEFHDETGFHYCSTEVIEGPRSTREGILLRNASDMRRSFHRCNVRIPTDLTVQVKEQIHVRRYDAALVNLSAGGALIRTRATFDFNTVIDMTLSLPAEPAVKIMAEVVHVMEQVGGDDQRTYGLRFLDLEPEVVKSITHYIWQRLPGLYPPRHTA